VGLLCANWFAASYAPMRKTERFKALMRKVGSSSIGSEGLTAAVPPHHRR
jgi:hypothetical protein